MFLIIGLCIYSNALFSQCSREGLYKEILAVYNSTLKTNSTQLKELLQLQKQMIKCNFQKDSAYMYLQQKLGILYFREGDKVNAISFTIKSINTAKQYMLNKSFDQHAIADNYYNLFFYYDQSAKEIKKYEAIDSCIKYVLQGNSGYDRAIKLLTDKTEHLYNTGEYDVCNQYADLGVNLVRNFYHEKDSIAYIVFFVTKKANSLYLSKNYVEAEKLLEDRISEFIRSGNYNQLYAFYNLLGLINTEQKNYVKASYFFSKAYHLSINLKFKNGSAESLIYKGLLYAREFKKLDSGLNYCMNALKYITDAPHLLSAYQQIGNIYALKKKYDSAQYFFTKAFDAIEKGMNETTMLKKTFRFPGFNLLQNLSDLTADKANAYLNEYYYTKKNIFLSSAIIVYKKADLFLSKIKAEQQLDMASNLIWRTTAHNLYEHAIEACYANNNYEDAFYFFEKSRAVLLNDQINEQRLMADTDIAKRADCKKAIIELEQQLEITTPSSKDYLTLQKKLYTYNQQLDVLIDSIKSKNPLFYQNYFDTALITPALLRKNILSNSKSLVEIFSGDSAIYILIITNTNQSFAKINKQLYDSLVKSFTSFIANRYILNEHFKDFIKTARQLYNLLFQNIRLAYGSIIISPDGKSYPFEALVMNDDINNPEYFLNHYATSYTYSVKYLTNVFANSTANSNSVLGIAPVRFKNYQNLPDLSGSDNSLKSIGKYFSNSSNFILDKATKNNFLQNFPDYKIIQLYTHASGSIAKDPVIYFSDSALYLSSLIPNSRPVTQLVVLSACETANGKLYHGEGIFSFNRGFAVLGIPAAISNLWSVDNISTYQITELFYKYLSRNLPTDIALQKAKLEFIDNNISTEKRLPYFWAATILTGKVDVIKSEPGFLWIKVIVITILLLLSVYLILKKYKVFRRRMGFIN